MKIFLKVIFYIFFPVLFFLEVLIHFGSGSAVGGTFHPWGNINLDFKETAKLRQKKYYPYIRFLFHKPEQPFYITLIRNIFFVYPLSIIILLGIIAFSALWSIAIFTLFVKVFDFFI